MVGIPEHEGDPRGWFDAARFGMFVHWGHPSQQGRELSWPLVGGAPTLPHADPVTVGEYYEAALEFDPEPGAATTWLSLARRVGMGYAVLTTKHHDGFALWPTDTTDFHVGNAAYGGDLVGEYVEAARAEGLRVGFYFSLSDWHHPDYPAFTDAMRPYAFVAYPRPDAETWRRFTEVMFEQVRELLTRYGPVDLLWFDGGWERSAAEWRSEELEALVRALQPEILLNDRLPGVGDYETPEQFVPPSPPTRRWEACMTMNQTWGHCPADRGYKTTRRLLHTLCEVAGRGGNLLLNVSPNGEGGLPAEQVERLEAIGQWMDRNGTSITDTRAGLEPWQVYGASTRRGDRHFVHLLLRPYDTVTVRGLPIRRVRSVRHHATGGELTTMARCSVLDEILNADPVGEIEIAVPPELVDDLATVLEVEISPP